MRSLSLKQQDYSQGNEMTVEDKSLDVKQSKECIFKKIYIEND